MARELRRTHRQYIHVREPSHLQVNNAGVAMVAPIELCPEAEFTKVMDVNVTGPLRVTQHFLPLLKRGDDSRIVNVGSQVG